MAENNLIKKTVTVDWILTAKEIVKFVEEPDTTYDMDKKILQFIGDVKEKDAVDISIDKSSNKVVFMKKSASTAPKAETKTENPSSAPTENVQEWTVKAITSKRDVIKFEESTDVSWYLIPEAIRPQFADIKFKDVICVTIGEQEEKGKMKPAVISVEKGSSVPATEQKSETSFSASPAQKNNSIESQVALKEAGAIVRLLIEKGDESVNSLKNIGEVLKELTKTALEAMHQ